MVETLIMRSLDTDNRVTVKFTDTTLPRYGRHGELFVVDGILYIYADFNNSNIGRWFPLTNEKEIFVYEQDTPSNLWTIPTQFHTDNVQVIVYGDDGLIYLKDYGIDVDDQILEIMFEELVAGKAHIIVNRAFDWLDRKFVVADRNFVVSSDDHDVNAYFIEIDTEYVEILKNGNTTFRRDFTVEGNLNVSTITNLNDLLIEATTTVDGDLSVTQNLYVSNDTVIGGNLTVHGITTWVETVQLNVQDTVIILNSTQSGTPTQDASINVNRGSLGNLPIITFDESNDCVTLTIVDSEGEYVQEEAIGKESVVNMYDTERDRALVSEHALATTIETNYNELNDKTFNESIRARNAETTLTNGLNSELLRASYVEGVLRDDVDLKALQSLTYTMIETDNLIESATTPQKTLDAIKQVHGVHSGLDAALFGGKLPSSFNQVMGVSETIALTGPEIITDVTLNNGVITSVQTRPLVLADLNYTEEQAIETIIGLRDLLNVMTSRIEVLESLI